MSAELEVNVERRRAGEVALGILPDPDADTITTGFAWVPAQDAVDFAWSIIRAARESEDMAAERLPEKGEPADG